MIPQFTEHGLLPPGIHQATRAELHARFAVFDRSCRRLQVAEQLGRFLAEAESADHIRRLILGGSFVTAKAEPNDFDCILVVDAAIVGAELRPFEYNLISRRRARRMFGGDVLVAVEGSAALEEYLEFFQTTRDGLPMGIIEVLL